MRAFVSGDIPTNYVDIAGDELHPEIPDDLQKVPLDHLRFVEDKFVDVSSETEFYVDQDGLKHAVQGEGWAKIACGIDDHLELRDNKWVAVSQLDIQKRVKLQAIYVWGQTAMEGGFESAALGELHDYPSRQPDQTNVMAAAVAAVVDPEGTSDIRCAEPGQDEYKLAAHSAAQATQAARDCRAMINRAIKHIDDLSKQVSAASSQEELDAIVW